MKKTVIKQNKNIFTVLFEPDWIERIFGCKKEEKKYALGHHLYVDEDGVYLRETSEIHELLDGYRRRLHYFGVDK